PPPALRCLPGVDAHARCASCNREGGWLMGQAIATRTEVRGILICRSPVHVGGWDSTAEANLTVARDGLGRPVLPGTSIAGALRAYLARLDRFSRGHRLSVL